MHIVNGDIRLHIADDGRPDAPPILVLHGVIASHRTWDWIVPLLADQYRVLRLDFRGHGLSDRSPAYDLDGYVADAMAALEQVARRPCPVIGHSLGGLTAAALAQRRPDLVTAVVLEDPPYRSGDEPAPPALLEGFRLMRSRIPELQAAHLSPDELAAEMSARPSPAGPPFGELLHPDALLAGAASFLRVDARVLDGVLDGRLLPTHDWTQEIPVPTLLVAADPRSPDAATTAAGVDALRASTPTAEIHVLERATHLIHEELAQRDRMAELVTDFLARAS